MNFDKPDRLDFLPQNGISEAPGTLTENLTTAFDTFVFKEGAGSASQVFTMVEVWNPIIDALKENGADFVNPGFYKDSYEGIAYDQKTQDIYSYIEENRENLPEDLTSINPEMINELARTFIAAKDADLAEMTRRSPGVGPAIARFAGGMASGVLDPVSVLSGPFGGFSKSLWKNVAQNTIINAGAGAVTEVAVKDWYEELGLDYTYQDFVRNVSMNAAFGAALPLGVAGIKMTWQQARKGVNALRGKSNLNAEDQALLDVLEDQIAIEESNPLEARDPNAAQFEHESRLEEATVAINNDIAPNMPDEPTAPINAQAATEAPDVDTIYRVEAKNIEVDAKTFQFKSGGDEFGVTARLQGITKWEPQWAGVVTVYEYADGRMAIADGHQRVGLAKRIMANDPSQNIKLNAYKLRQTDGISVEEARMIAALTNIVEGSGTAVDAAKVLRIDPSRLPDLPPMSELVQQAKGIMPLSDNSFGMVINGIVPPKYAMYVGRLIEDKGLQDAAMQVLAKSTPESKFQAEAMVRQVRDLPSDQVKQINLFGEEFMTESYVFERGKILSKAYTELRRDKAAFETLVRNSERLEAEGNVLVTDVNQRKATTDAQTIALLQTLANRKGPLSDALNEAARTARDTNDYGPATSGFLGAVRRAIDAGDFESVSNSNIGRFVDGSPEVSRPEVKEPDLDGFDEPTGVAADQQTDQLIQDMFGAEEVEVGSVQDLRNLLDQNPTREEIDSHPSVISALAELSSKSETSKAYGYDTDVWHNSRVYRINNEDVISTDEAILRFERDAEQLAFKELGLDVEPVLFNKELTIVLGPPASGKSTIANELAIANRSAILDSDEIKKTLPEYDGGVGASATHQESSDLAKSLQALMIERGTNIVLPKVGHTASSIRNVISLYKDKGYKVRLVNMDVTPENAYQRMIRRFVSSGRIIPPAYLDKVGSNPSVTYRTLKEEGVADGYAEIDNNGGFNEPKKVREISGDNPLSGSSFDVPSGRRTGPDAIRIAERDVAEGSVEAEAIGGLDMELVVPVGQKLNPDTNEVEIVSLSLRDLKGLMDEEDAMVRRLDFCTIGGNA